MQLDSKLRAKGVKPNSIAVYMRTLRALYNKAINFGVADQQEYPFRRYKIKGEQTPPRVASIEELKRFFSFTPSPDSSWHDAWNYGRLIFLLRGINFADLAFLTEENIRHGRLIYKRKKTHKMYSVELLPETLEILDYYKSSCRITLLPILTNDELKNPKLLPERIGQQTKNCNKWLKRIGGELENTEKLSTYVFRYSHANACKKLGFSKDLISESLGHAYGLAVSTAYLENFNVELIDDMNRKVVDEVSQSSIKLC
jgi:integrase